MYEGSKRDISNKAYAVVKRHWKGKFNRAQYRRDMKKFKISSRDADVLRTDFYNDRLKPLFKTAFTAKMDLTIYCCREGEVVYEPMKKIFTVDAMGKAKYITKREWIKAVIEDVVPFFVENEGNLKCKNMSSSLYVCPKYTVENEKYTEKGIPIKRKGK